MTNKDQYTEIKDIQWFTKEECINKIRKGNATKLKIINDILSINKYFLTCLILV